MFALILSVNHTECMELRQFVYFEAVARHGGFTRAAEQLHVAQTAVSAQVRKLERELGVVLLRRTTRRVALTQAGELALVRIGRILREVDGISNDCEEVARVVRGRVRIGAVDAVEPFDLDGSLASLVSSYPQMELTLRTAATGAELIRALDDDELDIILAPAPAVVQEKYSVRHLFSERLLLVTAVGSAAPASGPVELGAFADRPFVSFPAGTGLRRILDQAAVADGFTPKVRFETTSLTRMRGLVSNGLGVALLAESVAGGEGPPVQVHELAEPIERAIALIHRVDRPVDPATRACIHHLLTWRRTRTRG